MEQNLQNLQLPASSYMENNTHLLPQKQGWSGVYIYIYMYVHPLLEFNIVGSFKDIVRALILRGSR